MDNRVKVGIRVRPMVASEAAEGGVSVVRELVPSSEMQSNISKCVLVDTSVVAAANSAIPLKRVSFEYDWVFGPTASQQSVYSALCEPLVSKIFDGFNATVFAYGQTGSGKTFTMGNCSSALYGDGIITLAMRDIFAKQDALKEIDPANSIHIELSYLEVYMEECYDLLSGPQSSADRARLELRETPKGETYVEGLCYKKVKTVQEVASFLSEASQNRSMGKTAMNSHSSRSHSICTLHVKISRPNEGISTSSKLHLVDLAGSERVKKTMSTGDVFNEGVSINKGLFALGNVVAALAKSGGSNHSMDSNSNSSFIPYRESKLTRLLKDALGGNGLTVMLACVSPADLNVDESLNTLRFASRASSIVNSVSVNHDEIVSPSESIALRKEIQILKQQLDIFKMKCELLSTVSGGQPSARIRGCESAKSECFKAQTPQTVSLIGISLAFSSSLKNLLVHCLRDKVSLDSELVSTIMADVDIASKSFDLLPSSSSISLTDSTIRKMGSDRSDPTSVGSTLANLIETISIFQKKLGNYDKISGDLTSISSCPSVLINSSETSMDEDNASSKSGRESIESEENMICDSDLSDKLDSLLGGLNEGDFSIYEKHMEQIADDEARVEEDIQWKQNEIAKITALAEKFETTISQLKNEITTLQMDKTRLQQVVEKTGAKPEVRNGSSILTSAATEETRVKKELKEKSRLLEEKLKELKLKESEYNRAQMQRATFSKEAEVLRRDLEESKRKRAELMRKMKEETAHYNAERQKLLHMEVSSKRREIKALSSMADLKTEFELKEKVWRGQLAAKERENKQLQELIDKQSKVKQYKDAKDSLKLFSGNNGQAGQQIKPGADLTLTLQKMSELKVWVTELTEAQTLRLSLQEEIQRLLDQRGKIARRLQSLRSQKLGGAEPSAETPNLEAIINNANASVNNHSQVAVEIKSLEEDVRKRSVEISQKQKELADLGKENEKKRFENISDVRDAKFVMEWMFDKITKNSSTHQKSLELKIRSQSDQIDYLKRVISHNTNSYGSGQVAPQALKKKLIPSNSVSSENSYVSGIPAPKQIGNNRSNIPNPSGNTTKHFQARLPLRPVSNNGSTNNNTSNNGVNIFFTATNNVQTPGNAKSAAEFKSPAVNPFIDISSGDKNETFDRECNVNFNGRINDVNISLYPMDDSIDSGNNIISDANTSVVENACDDDISSGDYDSDELEDTFYEDEDDDEDYDPDEECRGRLKSKGAKRARPADDDASSASHLNNSCESTSFTTSVQSSTAQSTQQSKRFASAKNVERMLADVLVGTNNLLSFASASTSSAKFSVPNSAPVADSESRFALMASETDSNISHSTIIRPLSKYTVKELKSLLAQRGLPVMGLKDELVARLEQFEAAQVSREISVNTENCPSAPISTNSNTSGALPNPFRNVLLRA